MKTDWPQKTQKDTKRKDMNLMSIELDNALEQ
jgi:hypothetical protein